MTWVNKTHVGDCRELMRKMATDGVKVQTCVTSPPYYGLRDYGVAGQIGLEPSLNDWLDTMVEVFDAVWEVLAEDGTLWLNLGDSYAHDGKWGGETGGKQHYLGEANRKRCGREKRFTGLKPKDLIGQPWRVAFALQDAGWYLRSEIIWHKPNPMPEPCKDRPTKAHETIFLLSRSPTYHFDAEAIAEPVSANTLARMAQNIKAQRGSDRAHAGKKTNGAMKAFGGGFPAAGVNPKAAQHDNDGLGVPPKQNASMSAAISGNTVERRNTRTVWTMPTEGLGGGHFATFPRELPRRCILAGSKNGDVVLDPFMGSGTVAQVATDLGRQFIGCELNPEYVAMHEMRRTTTGMAL